MTDRIHFVVPGACQQLCAQVSQEGIDAHWPVFSNGPEAWCLQAFAVLQTTWPHVTCSGQFESTAINVAHVASMTPFAVPPETFVVGVRADYPPHPLAHLHIVQNQTQVSDDSFWIPHWPQPGLIPRSPSRQQVINVAYAGLSYYMAGHRQRWESACRRRGLAFRTMGNNSWNDFSEIDIAIAIRTFDGYSYDKKPPSKLFNAWHAAIPLIAGNDSAFQQVGSAGTDYVVANTFAEAMDAIERLSDSQHRYQQIVDNGRARATQYSRIAISKHWQAFFREIAVPRFRKWRAQGRASRVRWLTVNIDGLARSTIKKARSHVLGPPRLKR